MAVSNTVPVTGNAIPGEERERISQLLTELAQAGIADLNSQLQKTLGRNITNDEKLSVTGKIYRKYGYSYHFDDPLPSQNYGGIIWEVSKFLQKIIEGTIVVSLDLYNFVKSEGLAVIEGTKQGIKWGIVVGGLVLVAVLFGPELLVGFFKSAKRAVRK